MNPEPHTTVPTDPSPSRRPARRHVIWSAAALTGLAATAAATTAIVSAGSADPADSVAPAPPAHNGEGGRNGTELLLLGTAGGPVPMNGRSGISSALVVDGRVYLIDLGPGAFGQFSRAGLAMDDLAAVYVTHLHSDHVADLYTLFWLRSGGYEPLTRPVDVYGPGRAGALPATYPAGRRVTMVGPDNPTPGVTDLINKQIAATAYDINIRMRNEGWPDIRDLVRTHDIELPASGASPTGKMAPPMEPFEVMSDERVRVTAILVDHPPVFPSYAFRFDTDQGSVVFSGDTGLTQNIVTLARGADILVHEAIDMKAIARGGLSRAQQRHMETGHTDVTKLGAIAQKAGVGTLVLNHLVPAGVDLVPDELWSHNAAKGFDGRVVVGRDLMRMPVGAARKS